MRNDFGRLTVVRRHGGYTLQNADLLLTIAEVAVAFTGFASLVSVLSSPSIQEHPLVQSIRFRAMVTMSLIVVAFSLVPFVPLRLGVSAAVSWRISSALFLLAALVGVINGARHVAIARATVGRVKGGNMRLVAIFGGAAIAILLLGANTLGFTAVVAPGIYAAALLLFLFGSGAAFAALLFSHIYPITKKPPAT